MMIRDDCVKFWREYVNLSGSKLFDMRVLHDFLPKEIAIWSINYFVYFNNIPDRLSDK